MDEPEQIPSTMPGLHVYQGRVYWGQIVERVGPGLWLMNEPDGVGFRIETASNLRWAQLYKERLEDEYHA